MDLSHYISQCYQLIPLLREYNYPWEITNNLKGIIERLLQTLSQQDYHIEGTVAIHKGASVEPNVTIREFVVIEEGSTVKAGSYLREGVYIGRGASVGANCEIKQSIIFDKSRIAHLNYVGNSIIGEDVNMEAGSVLANHFNERKDKNITVVLNGSLVSTGTTKFGSLLGDECRIGANAVLNPGTVMPKQSIVGRLTHIDQVGSNTP